MVRGGYYEIIIQDQKSVTCVFHYEESGLDQSIVSESSKQNVNQK